MLVYTGKGQVLLVDALERCLLWRSGDRDHPLGLIRDEVLHRMAGSSATIPA
jgi:hypothetical protein